MAGSGWQPGIHRQLFAQSRRHRHGETPSGVRRMISSHCSVTMIRILRSHCRSDYLCKGGRMDPNIVQTHSPSIGYGTQSILCSVPQNTDTRTKPTSHTARTNQSRKNRGAKPHSSSSFDSTRTRRASCTIKRRCSLRGSGGFS